MITTSCKFDVNFILTLSVWLRKIRLRILLIAHVVELKSYKRGHPAIALQGVRSVERPDFVWA